MQTLRASLQNADTRHAALGHFNVSDLLGIHALVHVARPLAVLVMVGVSEGERQFIGVEEIALVVRTHAPVYRRCTRPQCHLRAAVAGGLAQWAETPTEWGGGQRHTATDSETP